MVLPKKYGIIIGNGLYFEVWWFFLNIHWANIKNSVLKSLMRTNVESFSQKRSKKFSLLPSKESKILPRDHSSYNWEICTSNPNYKWLELIGGAIYNIIVTLPNQNPETTILIFEQIDQPYVFLFLIISQVISGNKKSLE